MSALYIDSSAFVKTVIIEPESRALLSFLARARGRHVSCTLLRTEAIRSARRHGPDAIAKARSGLEQLDLIAINNELLEGAGTLDPATLRTLDAIHLACALSLGDELETVVTYDQRMAEGARSLGLAVATPR